MKHQTRPFVVEVKQKRRNSKQSHSIWGDVDLSGIVAETTRVSEKEMELPDRQLIDSDVAPIDVEDGYKPPAEHLMAESRGIESVQTTIELPAKAETVEVKKRASKAAKAQPKASARKAAIKSAPAATDPPATVRKARKIYSVKERGQLLSQIEKLIGGGASIKSATGQAGISEQTYYQWKKVAAPAADSGDLRDLVALEEENKRLKNLLADRLRKENAELKKKLGLA
ncbi:transposase [Mesorhizobium sp. M1338]|uniref:transposase n=1 Tax=unclassified Mesorhizobium TaxID=325217 RepID=UPI00333DD947